MAVFLILFCCYAAGSAQFMDELQSYSVECLSENVFECSDGGCIPQDRYCDSNYDCKDGSDENFCSNHKADATYCNETHQFLCDDGKYCIPNSWVCNFEADCEDKSDELNCTVTVIAPNATCKGFQCDGTRCISKFWMCDGSYDCEDKTDEDIENTCRNALRPREMNNGLSCKIVIPGLYDVMEYSCLDRSFCVPRDHMCDGIKDCKDGSDEGTFCQHWNTMCANFPCNGTKCVPDRSGPYCDCQSSHSRYNYTTQRCETVNNCLDDVPWCSHTCERTEDAFKCECQRGYDVDFAGYLCYAPDPEAKLFYSTRNDIRYIGVKSKTNILVASGIKQAHGVTYDGTYVYWVETAQGHQAIVRAHFDNVLETKEVLVALGLEDPGDIAIDWLGGNIYFTDVERGVISVCKSDGSVCSVLHADTKQPRYVTLDPGNGKMFWADWQYRPLIVTSRMDGTQPEILVETLGGFATGLALDAPNERLYFVDGTIRVVKLFDKNVYSLFEEPFHHPYSISVFENTVYWSDWTSKTIQTSDKLHSADKRAVLVTMDEPVFDMHIYHPLLMPQAPNPCQHNGCSHICIPTSNSTYSCVCPEGMETKGHICTPMPEYRPQYLVVGGGSLFTRIQYSVLGNPEAHTIHFDIARVQAMAYDNYRDTLYVYDGHRKSINYINMSDFTLGVTRLFTYKALDNVVDMGYDYVSDALYILDAGRRMIDVISLRTHQRTLVHRFSGQEIPISFCIVPEYGRLVVALVESEFNNEIYVDSMGLDGADRTHIFTNNILGPNIRLRYSSEMDIIYIADEGNGIIDYFHPEGTGREHFREITTTIANLAVTDTHVFWTDRHTQRVYWADVHKHGHKIRRMDLSLFPNNTFLHLQVTSPPPDIKNPLTKHACFQNPNPCSHICVQIPHPIPQDLDMGYKCICPIGLLQDGDKCVELAACKLHESYCHRSNECFLSSKRCDGNKDCKYGEDEENCPPRIIETSLCNYGQKLCNNACIRSNDVCKENAVTVVCSSKEFQCGNTSICVDRSSVCNGLSDCPHGSDETPEACDTIQCLETEFMCASGSCIPSSWKCDASEDCADGSDEINCETKTCAEGFFQCGDRSCIALSKRCDGHYDCFDAVDEDNCDLPEIVVTVNSNSGTRLQAWQDVNEPYPTLNLCNGKVDCPGGTDEAGCDFHCAPNGLYPCKQELKCITKSQLCNGRKDCTDGSDETIESCIKANKTIVYHTPDASPQTCHNGYKCDSGKCVEWRQVCDNVTNCHDGSDENGLCSTPCNMCPNYCHQTPRGPKCICPHGYIERVNACDDVDECVGDVCSHVCQNIPGSFVCSCHTGYALRSDRRSCKALRGDATVLYAAGADIWSVRAHHHYLDYTYTKGTAIDDLDYDFRNNRMYIAVSKTEELVEINRNQKTHTITAISNVGKPTKVSVDWIAGNVYFVDANIHSRFVRVCNFGKKVCARLQKLPSNAEVTSLTVDPVNRRMFYCIVQSHESIIRSASLSGRGISDLGAVGNCSALAADSFGKLLYVIDTPGRLWKVDYDGKNWISVLKNSEHMQNPHSPILFEDHIYFIDNDKFKRCSLFASKTCEKLSNLYTNATSFILHQENIQRVDAENMCANSVCSNVCVMESAPMCVCADGSLSSRDTCPILKPKELLMINGQVQHDAVRNSVTFTLTLVILLMFSIYLCVFVHYHFITKCTNRPGSYMQVRYQNRPDAITELPNAFIEVPTAGGIGHQFVNPLLYVRSKWQETFYRNKPIGTATFTFDTQQDLSDTESDVDVRETKRFL